MKFMIGQRVEKIGGDYSYEGVIVAIFTKRDHQTIRLVVENDGGMLFIFNETQIELVKRAK